MAASRCVSMNAAAAAACSSGTVAICRANPIQCGSFGTISRPHSTVRYPARRNRAAMQIVPGASGSWPMTPTS